MSTARPRPRMSDVAAEAGVALATVSRALNEPHMVRAQTLARVHEAVARLGYVPDLTAGSLASSRSWIVGAVVPTLANVWFAETMEGMAATLAAAGYHLMLSQSRGESEAALVDAFLGRRVDAIALTGASHEAGIRERLKAAGIPVVELWDLPGQPLDMAVGFSNAEVGACVARHFVATGRRCFGFLGADEERSLQRRDGYAQALQTLKAGGPITAELIAPYQPMEAGAAAMQRLMRREPRLDAIFCSNDTLAAGALQACRDAGWAVPVRVAVAGFSDMPIARACVPALTTVRVEPGELGRRAAQLLLRRLAGERVPRAQRQVDLGFELVVRASG